MQKQILHVQRNLSRAYIRDTFNIGEDFLCGGTSKNVVGVFQDAVQPEKKYPKELVLTVDI
jgi:hypothetical protein